MADFQYLPAANDLEMDRTLYKLRLMLQQLIWLVYEMSYSTMHFENNRFLANKQCRQG